MTGPNGSTAATAHEGPLMFVRYAYPAELARLLRPGRLHRLPRVRGGRRGRPGAGPAGPGVRRCLAVPGADRGRLRHQGPLDRRVVEAYWVGNDLLDQVPVTEIGNSMAERFRPGRQQVQFLTEGVLAGGVPHHSFHVFGVYPWVACSATTARPSTP